MKKIFSLILAAALAVSLTACGGDSDTKNTPSSASGTSSSVSGLTEAIAETPAIITSAGQSADASMLSAILKKDGFECDTMTSLAADDFDTSAYKTLILGVGGSQKGLGAAGVDADAEQARVDAVVKKAKDAGMTIVVAHIGGEARRGELSDGFIQATAPEADYLLVVTGGDRDGLFSQIASDNGIPMDIVDSLADVGAAVMKAFK